MKTRYVAALVFIIGAASAITTGADDLQMRIHNDTNLEVVWPTVYTESDGGRNLIRSGFLSNVLPGMSVLISQSNAGKPVRMTIDMGLAAYTFGDLGPLGDLNGVEVTLGFDWEAYRPFLEKLDIGTPRLYGEVAAAGRTAVNGTVTQFEALLTAKPEALDAMAGGDHLDGTEEVVMPVAFADGMWRCGWNRLFPEDAAALPVTDAIGPEGATMWAHCNEALLRETFNRLQALGYRTWSIQAETLEPGGSLPDLVDNIILAREGTKTDAASMLWERRPSRPGAVLALLTTEQTRVEALGGEVVSRHPAFMVRVSNSALLEVSYYSDCRTLVALSRESLFETAAAR